MSLSGFLPGETVHCYLSSCATSSGGIVTPTPIMFDYWWPTSTDRTRLTTSSGITTGDSSGEYYAEVVPTTSQVGLWDYRWSSTGTYKITQWGSFKVLEPPRST